MTNLQPPFSQYPKNEGKVLLQNDGTINYTQTVFYKIICHCRELNTNPPVI
jgi:hypothetical protein